MKKTLKITWITLASIVGVVILTAVLALYLVLTPKRVTSLVNKYAPDFVTCGFSLEKAEITIFKTFPDVGIEIHNLVLENPMEDSPSDTLAAINSFVVSVDAKKLLKENAIVVKPCTMEGGFANIFIDKDGKTNFDIVPPSEEETEEEEESTAWEISLNNIDFKDINVIYTDLSQDIKANIDGFSFFVNGKMKGMDDMTLNMKMNIENLAAKIDSDSTKMDCTAQEIKMDGNIKTADNETYLGNIIFGLDELCYSNIIDTQFVKIKQSSFSYDGAIKQMQIVDGKLSMTTMLDTLALADMSLDKKISLNFFTDLLFDSEKMNAVIREGHLAVNNAALDFSGTADMGDSLRMPVNIDIATNEWVIEDLIALVPAQFASPLSGITVTGKTDFNAHIEGVYSDEMLPDVAADFNLKNVYASAKDMLPYPVRNVNVQLHADYIESGRLNVTVSKCGGEMKDSKISLSGRVNDVLGEMLCDLTLNTNVNIDDVKSYIPEDIKAHGKISGNVKIKGKKDDFVNMDLMRTNIDGKLTAANLDVIYFDTITLKTNSMSMGFTVPNNGDEVIENSLARVVIGCDNCDAAVRNMTDVALNDFSLDASISNVMDSTSQLAALADFSWNKVNGTFNDMDFCSQNASGTAMLLPQNGIDNYIAVYTGDSLSFKMSGLDFATETLSLNAFAINDSTKTDIFEQFDPIVDFSLDNAHIEMDGLKEPADIQALKIKYDKDGLVINEGKMRLGRSDFALNGKLAGIPDYIRENDLLYGQLDFTSDYTDVNEILNIVSGLGSDETTASESVSNDTVSDSEPTSPFIVPVGSYIVLNANIKKASALNMEVEDIRGGITVKDGTLLIQDVGFTSNAAKMLLTAMYKSPKPTHLYAGVDFHLLDIDIAEMIRIVPALDTVLPMLKSFAGKGEFHIAAEVNMKSDYTPKYSTLLGSCSIKGNDLVILDEDTYHTMAKYLMFKYKDRNKIDSLSVEIVAKGNDVDVYPFLVTMDKYSFKLEGRHRLDMTFNYSAKGISPGFISHFGVKVRDKGESFKWKPTFSLRRNKFQNQKSKNLDDIQEKFRRLVQKNAQDNIEKYYKHFE